jgi:hypothetical protein
MGAGDPDQESYKMKYQAGAAANVIVSATPAFLHSIIVGEVQAGGIIEVSNHATDGDGAVVLYIDDAPVGTILVDTIFDVGIAVDMTTQTHCTFVWR